MRKLITLILILQLTACAGFRPASVNAYENYNSNIALKLADFSNLAYEKDEDNLKELLKDKYPDFTLLRKIEEDETGYDSQAFVAYDDNMIIVSVRGSEIPFISMDWRNNAKFIQYTNKRVTEYCEGAGIHGGFFQSALRIGNTKLNSLENTSIYTKIEELQKNTNRDLYFTGHSLGGAIAEILAFFSAYETNMDITAVYTYGEPKNGNLAYRDCHDKVLRDKTFRFINNRDIVARVRGSGEYSHVGNLAYFDRNGNLSDINTYSSYLGITGDVLLLRFAFDHKLANYIELLEKNINVQPYSSQPNKLSKGTP